MAELLVRAVDNTNADSIKDRQGSYKRGDIVQVALDGHEWGKRECPPAFFIIRVPDTPVEELSHLIEPQEENDKGEPYFKNIGFKLPVRAVYRRRAHALDLAQLPPKILRNITQGKVVRGAALKKCLHRKRDGKNKSDKNRR